MINGGGREKPGSLLWTTVKRGGEKELRFDSLADAPFRGGVLRCRAVGGKGGGYEALLVLT